MSALIQWGDGTSYPGVISIPSGDTFTVTASHVYQGNSTYPIKVTIVDGDGAAASAGTTFSGGLEINNGNLNFYVGPTHTLLGSGVRSYEVQDFTDYVDDYNPQDNPYVLALQNNGSLVAFPSSAPQPNQVGDAQQIAIAPDETTYALVGTTLFSAAPGSSLGVSAGGVQTILEDSNQTFYELQNGTLSDQLPGGTLTQAQSNVRSIALDPSDLGIDVMETNGTYWFFNGFNWTLLANPHFVLNVPSSTTAGQSVPVSLSVMDALNEQVTGYTGTVQFTTTDTAAAALPAHTFTASNGGVFSFNETFTSAARRRSRLWTPPMASRRPRA